MTAEVGLSAPQVHRFGNMPDPICLVSCVMLRGIGQLKFTMQATSQFRP